MKHFYGWRIVAACMVANLLGNAFGLFGVGVYLHALAQTKGWPVGDISVGLTLFFVVSAVLQLPVGRTISGVGPKPVIAVGALAMAIALLGLGRAQSIGEAWLAFAGMGVSWACLSITAITAILAPWFEKYQGSAASIASLGANIGGIIGAPILLYGIGRMGLGPTTLMAAGTSLVILLPLAVFVLKRSPQEIGLLPDGAAQDSIRSADEVRWTLARAARTLPLWTVIVAFSLVMCVQIGFLTHQVSLLSSTMPPAMVSLTVSLTAAAALVGRLCLAHVADKIDQRVIAASVFVIAAATFAAFAVIEAAWLLTAASIVFGLTVGNTTILSPIIVRREFGAAAFGTVFGFASSIVQLVTALGPSFYGLMRETTLSYQTPLLIAAGLDVIAACAILSGRRRAA
jgi:MFS family permease